jgi:lipopolysaccharide transport system permease protein
LLFLLAARDVKVRYQQALLGAAWAVLQPLAGTFVLTLVFGALLRPRDLWGYAAFVCSGLVPWTYFAGAVTRCASSLTSNPGLVTKVYFPRILLPLSASAGAGVDFAVGLAAAAVLAVATEGRMASPWMLLPALVLCLVTTLGAGLWVAALNARFRDVGHILPFLLSLGLFATPVLFETSRLPRGIAAWLDLNPLAWTIAGFRQALLGGQPAGAATPAWCLALGLLASGVVVFSVGDRTLADVV